MELILTAAAMREADRLSIEEYGIPGFTLMETAGRAAADAVELAWGPLPGKRIACLCGKGNNGGDGLVVARVLHARGAHVDAWLLGEEDALSPDAALNLRLLRRLAEHDADGRLHLAPVRSPDDLDAVPAPDVFVDALLGTGLMRPLREPILGLVQRLNEQPRPTVALDVPTGLHSDTGEALGDAVRAALTVTMGAPKRGLYLGEGPDRAGRVVTAEIGIPGFVIEQVHRGMPGCALRTTDAGVRVWLPQRPRQAHKYSVGLALVVAGSAGLTGAPVMASTAAARSGAGAVVCACPSSIQPVLAGKLTEVMTLALPEADDGIDADGALDLLAPRLRQARALLLGCGLGRQPATQRFVRRLLEQTDLPVVVDADGLNALVGHTDLLARHAGGRWILTPHAGEFKRLAGEAVDVSDRAEVALEYARRWNVHLLLKGMPGLVATPAGALYVNSTGNPAVATAGTGDVLAGLCAGLLAQGLSPEAAAVCGLHLGGAAADRYAAHYSPRSMIATDLLEQVPLVLSERFS